jgi:hypothetical protein
MPRESCPAEWCRRSAFAASQVTAVIGLVAGRRAGPCRPDRLAQRRGRFGRGGRAQAIWNDVVRMATPLGGTPSSRGGCQRARTDGVSGLFPLVIKDVADEDERIVVRARTPQGTAVCPVCEASSGQVHGFHLRTVADVPVDGRRAAVGVRVRRLVCPTRGCRQSFREQMPGVLERYQRRTARLTRQVKAMVAELAGRAGSRLLAILTAGVSRHTALRALLRIPLPTRRTPA